MGHYRYQMTEGNESFLIEKNMNVSKLTSRKSFYRLAGICTVFIVLIFIAEFIVFLLLGPQPSTALDWFNSINHNMLVGMLHLYSLDILAWILFIPFFLALYEDLKSVNPMYSLLAITIAIIGIVLFFSQNITFSMLYLSSQYATADNNAQKSILLSSGTSMISIFNGTGAAISVIFMPLAQLILSIIMLKNSNYYQFTGVLGIIVNACNLLYYIPIVGNIIMAIVALPTLLWYSLISLRFYYISAEKG